MSILIDASAKDPAALPEWRLIAHADFEHARLAAHRVHIGIKLPMQLPLALFGEQRDEFAIVLRDRLSRERNSTPLHLREGLGERTCGGALSRVSVRAARPPT